MTVATLTQTTRRGPHCVTRVENPSRLGNRPSQRCSTSYVHWRKAVIETWLMCALGRALQAGKVSFLLMLTSGETGRLVYQEPINHGPNEGHWLVLSLDMEILWGSSETARWLILHDKMQLEYFFIYTIFLIYFIFNLKIFQLHFAIYQKDIYVFVLSFCEAKQIKYKIDCQHWANIIRAS